MALCTFPDFLISDYRFIQITLFTEHFYCHSPFKCYICLLWSFAFWRLSQINICRIRCENKTNKFIWKYLKLLHYKLVNLLHVSATFWYHLQVGGLRRIYHKDIKSNVHFIWYPISSYVCTCLFSSHSETKVHGREKL